MNVEFRHPYFYIRSNRWLVCHLKGVTSYDDSTKNQFLCSLQLFVVFLCLLAHCFGSTAHNLSVLFQSHHSQHLYFCYVVSVIVPSTLNIQSQIKKQM